MEEGYQVGSYDHEVYQGASFLAEFCDGNAFKNLIDYLKKTSLKAIFEFCKDGIECLHHHSDGTSMFNHVQIEGHELLNYEFKHKEEVLRIGVDLKELHRLIKKIGKKDGLRIWKKEGEHPLYIQITGGGHKSSKDGFSVILPQFVSESEIAIPPEYATPEDKSNCKIAAQAFSQTCDGVSNSKSGAVRIRVSESELILDNIGSGSISGRVDKFSMKPGNPEESYELFCELHTIKSLVKLANLSSNGIIKVYTEEKLPLKLMSYISNYGCLRVYIGSIPSPL